MLEICKETRCFDQVNRMAIPPQFREHLKKGAVIVKSVHNDPCLVIFPLADWERFSASVTASYTGRDQARAERKLANRSERVNLDSAGRIMVKDDFKAFAKLDREALVVGVAGRIELWNQAEWDAYNADDNKDDIDLSGASYSQPVQTVQPVQTK